MQLPLRVGVRRCKLDVRFARKRTAGAIYQYTSLARQVISKDADVYGLAEALGLNSSF